MNTSKTRAKTAGPLSLNLNGLEHSDNNKNNIVNSNDNNGKYEGASQPASSWTLNLKNGNNGPTQTQLFKFNPTKVLPKSASAQPHRQNQSQNPTTNNSSRINNNVSPQTNFQYLLLPPPRSEHPLNLVSFPTGQEGENRNKWLAPSLPVPKTSHSAKRFAKSIPSLINLSSITLPSSASAKSASSSAAAVTVTTTNTTSSSTTRLIRANRYRKHLGLNSRHENKISTTICMPQTQAQANSSSNSNVDHKNQNPPTSLVPGQVQNYTVKNVSGKRPKNSKKGEKSHKRMIEKTLTINDIKRPSAFHGLTLTSNSSPRTEVKEGILGESGSSLPNDDDGVRLIPVSSLLATNLGSLGKSTSGQHATGHGPLTASTMTHSSERMQVIRTDQEKLRNPDTIRLDKCGLKHFPLVSPSTEPNLKLLSLQHNFISRLENVPSLSHLVVLDLYDNRIERISGLQGLNSLRVLLLGKNRIRRIEGLDGLKRLEVLDLHGNQLRYVDNLGCLIALRVLNLAGNNFKTIRLGSYGLLSLTELNLKRNRIRNLEGLHKAPHLKKLLLANNELVSTSSLHPLRKLVFLQELLFEPNPLCSTPDYTSQILSIFPWLEILDRDQITDQQRIEAKIWHRKKMAEEEEKRNNSKTLSELSKVRTSPPVKTREEIIVEARRRWQSLKNFVKNSSTSKDLDHDLPCDNENEHDNDHQSDTDDNDKKCGEKQKETKITEPSIPVQLEKSLLPEKLTTTNNNQKLSLNNNNNNNANTSNNNSTSSNTKFYLLHLPSNKGENVIRVSNPSDGKTILTRISSIPQYQHQNSKMDMGKNKNKEEEDSASDLLEKTVQKSIQIQKPNKDKGQQEQNNNNSHPQNHNQNQNHGRPNSKIAVVRPLIRFQDGNSKGKEPNEDVNRIRSNSAEKPVKEITNNNDKDGEQDKTLPDPGPTLELDKELIQREDNLVVCEKEITDHHNHKIDSPLSSNENPLKCASKNNNVKTRAKTIEKPLKLNPSTIKPPHNKAIKFRTKPRVISSRAEKTLGNEFHFNLQKLNGDDAIVEVEEDEDQDDENENEMAIENEENLGKESSMLDGQVWEREDIGNDAELELGHIVSPQVVAEEDDDEEDKFEFLHQNDTDFMDTSTSDDPNPNSNLKEKIDLANVELDQNFPTSTTISNSKQVDNISRSNNNDINSSSNSTKPEPEPDTEALILEKLESVLTEKRIKESNRVLRRSLSTSTFSLGPSTKSNTNNNDSKLVSSNLDLSASANNINHNNNDNNIEEQSSSLPVPNVDSKNSPHLRASSAVDITSQSNGNNNNINNNKAKDSSSFKSRHNYHRSASFDVRIDSSDSDSSNDDDTSSMMNLQNNNSHTNGDGKAHRFRRKFFPRKLKRERTISSSKGPSSITGSSGLSSGRRPQTVSRETVARNLNSSRMLKRCDSAVSISDLGSSSASAALNSAMKKQGTDYLVEIDGKILQIYGQGALKYTLMGFPTSLTSNVVTAKFHYISFDTIIPYFGKLRQIYPSLEHFQFRANNLTHLAQLNALSDLQGLTSLHITKEGNPLVGNELWPTYAAYRLSHWGLQNINGKEVISEYRGGVLTAPAKAFESLGYVALSCLPQTALTPLAKRLHGATKSSCFNCGCSPSGSSDDSGRRKPGQNGGAEQQNPCTSWDDDPVLLDVISKEALVYSPPGIDKERRKERMEIPVKIINSGVEILEKLDMLDKAWPSLLNELVQDIIGLDYLFIDNYMKKEMKKIQDIAMSKK